MDRRQFLAAATAACAAYGMAAVKSAEASNQRSELAGVCDIHLHAAPDSRARSLSEYDMALEAKAAGYRAVLFKSNDFSCHDRAYLLRQAVSGIGLFGSLVLNRATGTSLNVYAVEKALATTGRLCRTVWMPTLDAEYAVKTFKQKTPFIPVSDGRGKLLPETLRIMELCAQADVAFATGHSSPAESLLMAQAARDMGFKKCIITHPNTLIWKMTASQLEKAAELGAWIEFCYLGRFWGEDSAMPNYPRQSLQEAMNILRVAPERTFITTDLGQIGMPRPVEGMRLARNELLKAGFDASLLRLMLCNIPSYLIGLVDVLPCLKAENS